MKRETKRVRRVACSSNRDGDLHVWPIRAGSYEAAVDGNWPYGLAYTRSDKFVITALFACPWAEDVWLDFENDLEGKGWTKVRRWLIGRVREALKLQQ